MSFPLWSGIPRFLIIEPHFERTWIKEGNPRSAFDSLVEAGIFTDPSSTLQHVKARYKGC